MLRKLFVIVTCEYAKELKDSAKYQKWVMSMSKNGLEVLLFVASEDICDKIEQNQDILYITDKAFVLEALQAKGMYTIALYHSGTTDSLFGTLFAIEDLSDMETEFFHKVWQRFEGIPWHIIETDRLIIREMCPSDLDGLYEMYEDPDVTRYTEGLFQDKEKELQYIHDYINNVYSYYGFGTWMLVHKNGGELIGRAGFNYRPGYEDVELGFVIGKKYWRNGFAYEACKKLLEIGKSVYELENVQALVMEDNEASVCLLKKLGFFYQEDIELDGQKYQKYLRNDTELTTR